MPKKMMPILKWFCAMCLIPVAVGATEAPLWWSDYAVLDDSLPDQPYAAANQGQLKYMADKAASAFAEVLSDYDLSEINALVATFTTDNNYAAANLGQLKHVAQPFYDLLYANDLRVAWPEGMTQGPYPWSVGGGMAQDEALANIGQLKYLFSFDLSVVAFVSGDDLDGDQILDSWEIAFFGGSPFDVDPHGDPDGDGLTTLEEYQYGVRLLDPTLADTDADGVDDDIEIIYNQSPGTADSYDDQWPYFEDFDAMPAYSGWGGGYNMYFEESWVFWGSFIQSTFAVEGQALKCCGDYLSYHLSQTPDDRVVWVGMDLFPQGLQGSKLFFGEAGYLVDSAGQLQVYQTEGAEWETVANVPINEWAAVALRLDYDALTWSLYWNGELVSHEKPFAMENLDQFNSIPFPTGDFVVDNLYAGGEPPVGIASHGGTLLYHGVAEGISYVLLTDTLTEWDCMTATAITEADEEGRYQFDYVAAGAHFLKSFIDINGDGLKNQSEPYAVYGVIDGVVVEDNLDMLLKDSGDSDGDGIPDIWEDANGLDRNDYTDGAADADDDFLNNRYEYQQGSDPNNADGDGNGLVDGLDAKLDTLPEEYVPGGVVLFMDTPDGGYYAIEPEPETSHRLELIKMGQP